MSLKNSKCDRCNKDAKMLRMSYFNEDMCCMECLEKEKQHKDYEKAKEIELQHVKNKDYNFKGIGKPSDL